MVKENEQVDDIEIPEEESLEGLDEATDWKAKAEEIQKKHREAGIRNRERTKALKEKVALLEKNKSEVKSDDVLLQKMNKLALRAAGITASDEVELAISTAKKWGMDVEQIIDDEDFKAKLEKLQTSKANAKATSGIRGGTGSSGEKNTTEYWQAKGAPPTPADVPDRKTRAKIIREMMKGADDGGKKFYND